MKLSATRPTVLSPTTFARLCAVLADDMTDNRPVVFRVPRGCWGSSQASKWTSKTRVRLAHALAVALNG